MKDFQYRDLLLILIPIILLFAVLMFVEQTRVFILAMALRIFLIVKHNIVKILVAFFLVKGKFILSLFLKKIAIVSTAGLGKRYFIEKVINKNLKTHFFDHIGDDVKRLMAYVKNNFREFPLIKQIIAGFTFLGSLGFVGKFLGNILAMRVFIAKFWSLLLALFLKIGTGIVYFFTDYIWGSWIAPIIEIFIFSWLLEFLERVPLFKKFIYKIYDYFIVFFEKIEYYLEKIFHLPVRSFLKFMATKVKRAIYLFMGEKRISSWKRLKEVRELTPNTHMKLLTIRKERKESKVTEYVSLVEKLKRKRKAFSKRDFS